MKTTLLFNFYIVHYISCTQSVHRLSPVLRVFWMQMSLSQRHAFSVPVYACSHFSHPISRTPHRYRKIQAFSWQKAIKRNEHILTGECSSLTANMSLYLTKYMLTSNRIQTANGFTHVKDYMHIFSTYNLIYLYYIHTLISPVCVLLLQYIKFSNRDNINDIVLVVVCAAEY